MPEPFLTALSLNAYLAFYFWRRILAARKLCRFPRPLQLFTCPSILWQIMDPPVICCKRFTNLPRPSSPIAAPCDLQTRLPQQIVRDEWTLLLNTSGFDLRPIVLNTVTKLSVYLTHSSSGLRALLPFASISVKCFERFWLHPVLFQLLVKWQPLPSFNTSPLCYRQITNTDIAVLSQITLPFNFMNQTVWPILFSSTIFLLKRSAILR